MSRLLFLRCNAKYLWKRIPATAKASHAELGLIWNVGQKMWLRDFPGVYQTLSVDWSDNVSQIMAAVLGKYNCRSCCEVVSFLSLVLSAVNVILHLIFIFSVPTHR